MNDEVGHVEETGDGYVAFCDLCNYVSKSQPKAWRAGWLIRDHFTSAAHKRRIRLRELADKEFT